MTKWNEDNSPFICLLCHVSKFPHSLKGLFHECEIPNVEQVLMVVKIITNFLLLSLSLLPHVVIGFLIGSSITHQLGISQEPCWTILVSTQLILAFIFPDMQMVFWSNLTIAVMEELLDTLERYKKHTGLKKVSMGRGDKFIKQRFFIFTY